MRPGVRCGKLSAFIVPSDPASLIPASGLLRRHELRTLGALAVSENPLADPQARQIRYLRVSLTDRCNYRCTYCMPEQGVAVSQRADVLRLEEVVQICAAFARWGVDTVRLTGGEPTIRKGLVDLVEALTSIPSRTGGRLRVTMTTNGETLSELAAPLRRAGLGSVTVSVDSLRPDRFLAVTRRGHLDRVLAGLEAAAAAGYDSVKTNTVAVKGFNHDELGELAAFAWDRGITPRFIELMPMSSGDLFIAGELMPAVEVRDAVAAFIGAEIVPDDGAGVRGAGPSAYWRVTSGPHAGKRLGTIGAMTENFCEDCNRLRISATGQLHACLANDDAGDLRAALRSADPTRLESAVRSILGDKLDRHGFDTDGSGGPTKAMVSIGG
jgi:cyclic pyranopterin phosphate synthase